MDEVSCFHATADSEYNDIRAFGLKQPVAVIPNGIDLPEITGLSRKIIAKDSSHPYVLSLGRIHPKKALDRLIAGFSQVTFRFPNWQLRIVGPDEGGHTDALRRQVANLRLEGRVIFQDAMFGMEKFKLIRNASVFALPTLNENFGMTVAESLAAETPVISTKGAPWAGLVENRCGWWIEHGPDAMAAALSAAMEMTPEQRYAMGARGREWMRRDFGWDAIGRRMVDVYSWLVSGRDIPSCVRLK